MDKKLRVELTLAIVAVILVGCIGAGIYLFYKPKSVSAPTNSSPAVTTGQKTKVEDTSDPSVKKVTASKQDTIQVKSNDGTFSSGPVYTPTK